MSLASLSPAALELVTRAARQQLSIADGTLSELRPFLEHRVRHLFAVNVDGKGRQGIAVFYAPSDDVGALCPALGLSEAGRRLVEMGAFGDPDWKNGLYYAVLGAGGMTPGLPAYPQFSDRVTAAGELELVLELEEPELRYASAGGVGAPPRRRMAGGGLEPPPRRGQAIFTVGKDGAARWSYQLEGAELGRFAAAPAGEAASCEAELALSLLEKAKAKLSAPGAVLAAPPRPLGDGRYRVELLGLPAVELE